MLRYIAKLITTITFIITSVGAGIIFSFFYYGRGLPDYDYLKHYEPPALNRVYTSTAAVLKEYAKEKRIVVPLESIPPFVIQAFLAAEDKNFYYHCGVDIIGTIRAAFANTVTQNWQSRPGGASTITQQVAKNFLIGNERSFSRKVREAIMSFRLENALSKDRILELYLNEIYLGTGVYGVATAALTYFNKALANLTLEEVAFLAALPKAPSTYTCRKDLSRAKNRRNWVIDRMIAEGIVSVSEGELAKKKPIIFSPSQEIMTKAEYFTEEVRREVVKKFGPEKFDQGGMAIFTALDPKLQTYADTALREGLIRYDRRHGWRGPLMHVDLGEIDLDQNIIPVVFVDYETVMPHWLAVLQSLPQPAGLGSWNLAIVLQVTDESAQIGLSNGTLGQMPFSEMLWAKPCLQYQAVGEKPERASDVVSVGDVIVISYKPEKNTYQLEQIPDVTGAIVAINPHTGHVLAMTGGYSYEISQFNCATQALRQPGSAFKPFVYLAALEKGFTPETKILDGPLSVSLGAGRGVYAPQNYSRRYYGLSSLRVGLEQSRNVMTVRLAQRIGMKCIEKTAVKFNIMDRVPRQLAMALGAGETTALRLTAAYAMLANGGRKITPTFIDRIQDRQGKTIYQSQKNTSEALLASEKSIEHMTSMLQGVIERGTARRLQDLGHPIAGKTGTTNDYKDAWFIGFTPNLVVGVFVGFPSPKSLGDGETGGKVAAPIFKDFMIPVLQDQPITPFFQNSTVSEIISSGEGTSNLNENEVLMNDSKKS